MFLCLALPVLRHRLRRFQMDRSGEQVGRDLWGGDLGLKPTPRPADSVHEVTSISQRKQLMIIPGP